MASLQIEATSVAPFEVAARLLCAWRAIAFERAAPLEMHSPVQDHSYWRPIEGVFAVFTGKTCERSHQHRYMLGEILGDGCCGFEGCAGAAEGVSIPGVGAVGAGAGGSVAFN